jgi:prepilin-type N-terminal cleavage/methylation domain-containing protein
METFRMDQKKSLAANRRFAGLQNSPKPAVRRTAASAFTLTELLVVIAIIAILAALITAAAVNAMNASKRTAIVTEIRQLGDAMERFKTNLGGAYPPNVFGNGDTNLNLGNDDKRLNAQNVVRFMTKARPQSTENATNTSVSPPQRNSTVAMDNLYPVYELGIRPSEALVLWLSGFSADTKRPFSGADLEVTSIHDDERDEDISNVITFDAFDAPLYEFDKTRLKFSRNSDGSRRYLEVYGADGSGPAQLQLYEYFPKGSEQPYVYFSTVDTPQSVARTWQKTEAYYEDPKDPAQVIYPLKRMKPNAPSSPSSPVLQYVEYVNQGKYQILHPGLDDTWGDFSLAKLTPQQDIIPQLLFPTGPFTGDLADTLSNFADGTLENEQE